MEAWKEKGEGCSGEGGSLSGRELRALREKACVSLLGEEKEGRQKSRRGKRGKGLDPKAR